ncbi:hypothetical protein [Streptomyces sp. NPDC020489]|uniref:hypothetical protein n=1 Tax=Streptomyces sp. NPDC020489 TaxID=3365077 RepID=UPI0037A2CC40
MSENDPLLQFLSEEASDGSPQARKISVVVGGVRFVGYAQHPDVFLEEHLSEEHSQYRELRDAQAEAREYLHLIVSEGPGIPKRTNCHVRFRMDGVDAWWVE